MMLRGQYLSYLVAWLHTVWELVDTGVYFADLDLVYGQVEVAFQIMQHSTIRIDSRVCLSN